jgi:hypothetical protein
MAALTVVIGAVLCAVRGTGALQAAGAVVALLSWLVEGKRVCSHSIYVYDNKNDLLITAEETLVLHLQKGQLYN